MKTLQQIAGDIGVSIPTLKSRIAEYQDQTGVNLLACGQKSRHDARRTVYPSSATAPFLRWLGVEPSPDADEPTIDVGNGAVSVDVVLPSDYSLEHLRSVDVEQIQNPLAVADQVQQVTSLLIDAMRADITQRRDQLNQLEQAERTVQDAATKLQIESAIYRAQADQVNSQTNTASDRLQRELGKLDDLRGRGQ